MVDVRTLLAAVLGVGLGLVLIAAPEFVVQVHAVGRRPHGGRGEYGADRTVSERWHHVVRLVGVALVVAGGYFAYTLL
jgi:hypothetical protein